MLLYDCRDGRVLIRWLHRNYYQYPRGMALSALFFVNSAYQIFSQQSYFITIRRIQSTFIASLVCIPYVQLLIVGYLLRKLMKKLSFLRDAGVCLSRVLNFSRFSSRNSSTLLVWTRSVSRLHAKYRHVCSRSHSGRYLVIFMKENYFPERETGSVVPNIEPPLFRTRGWMFTTFNGTQTEVYYMMMFISSFVMMLLLSCTDSPCRG